MLVGTVCVLVGIHWLVPIQDTNERSFFIGNILGDFFFFFGACSLTSTVRFKCHLYPTGTDCSVNVCLTMWWSIDYFGLIPMERYSINVWLLLNINFAISF